MPRHLHEIADRRSLALHERVAQRLLVDPSLVKGAREVVERWVLMQTVAQPYVEAWSRILMLPVEEIASTLCETSEMASTLRQVSPFVGVLSPRERWQLLRNERATRELP